MPEPVRYLNKGYQSCAGILRCRTADAVGIDLGTDINSQLCFYEQYCRIILHGEIRRPKSHRFMIYTT
jgi:hypothetical protein